MDLCTGPCSGSQHTTTWQRQSLSYLHSSSIASAYAGIAAKKSVMSLREIMYTLATELAFPNYVKL